MPNPDGRRGEVGNGPRIAPPKGRRVQRRPLGGVTGMTAPTGQGSS